MLDLACVIQIRIGDYFCPFVLSINHLSKKNQDGPKAFICCFYIQTIIFTLEDWRMYNKWFYIYTEVKIRCTKLSTTYAQMQRWNKHKNDYVYTDAYEDELSKDNITGNIWCEEAVYSLNVQFNESEWLIVVCDFVMVEGDWETCQFGVM